MAASSSRAHLINQLSRRGSVSPRSEDYNTAASFDVDREALHSTAQMGDWTTQQPLPHYQQPLEYDQFPDEVSEAGSEGSADMSIELGRGVKRGARERDQDISSPAIFKMGNDSLYEVTGTPPIPARNSQRKTTDGLRRQASIRRAVETAKSNEGMQRAAGVKHRSLSEALNNMGAEDESSYMIEDAVHTATFNSRNTRFARARQTSTNEPTHPARSTSGPAQQTPRRSNKNNATVQSNSFMLPDLPNITELVSGVRKDGTPIFNKAAKSRSRFTSGSHNAARPEHYPIDNIPIPEEEKAIYASLQLLKDRVDQLEMEKSEAYKRSEEYEGEIIDLRAQLAVAQRRPDSALGSDEDSNEQRASKADRTKLQATTKALEDHLNRSERKRSVSEIAVKRVTKERDELVTQIGVAYYNNEELKAENEVLREGHAKLRTENDELNEEVDALRKENQDLRVLMTQMQASYDDDTQRRSRTAASAKGEAGNKTQTGSEARNFTRAFGDAKESGHEKTTANRRSEQKDRLAETLASAAAFDETSSDDLAIKIAQEVRRHREQATKARGQTTGRDKVTAARSRSKSATRQQTSESAVSTSVSRRNTSAPAEVEGSDAESTTQLDFTKQSRNNSKRASLPSPAKARASVPREEDSRDLTLLSLMDPNEVYKLRKKIEAEYRAARLKRNASAPEKEATQQSASGLPRKSSLKDVTTGLNDGTGRFSMAGDDLDEVAKVAKSVRVQSPHTIDESTEDQQVVEGGDTSMLSNTSRRRRRAASAEAMTSAFILPDITLHGGQDNTPHGKTTIAHSAGKCTACHPTSKEVSIPTPIPVTDREDVDVTNATIRPAQAPPLALATVIKQLQDEITHLKIQLATYQRLYNQHDPALSKRRRIDVKSKMDSFTTEIEKRSDQVYALFDVLEGQKEAAKNGEKPNVDMDEQEVEETLQSLGIDPVELSGRIGRKAPFGLDGAADMSGDESEELPWEGLSDAGSEN